MFHGKHCIIVHHDILQIRNDISHCIAVGKPWKPDNKNLPFGDGLKNFNPVVILEMDKLSGLPHFFESCTVLETCGSIRWHNTQEVNSQNHGKSPLFMVLHPLFQWAMASWLRPRHLCKDTVASSSPRRLSWKLLGGP